MSEPSNGRFKFLARLFAWDVLLDLETARNQQSSYLQGPVALKTTSQQPRLLSAPQLLNESEYKIKPSPVTEEKLYAWDLLWADNSTL